jgi:3-phenylpropionate/cinnamic acid dioxygenase small subunit
MQAEARAVDAQTRQEIEDFLYYEAELLDERRFEEWVELFAEDARYEMPIRVTREKRAGWELAPNGKIFDDSKATLNIRVQRLGTEYAWAEDPPSRTRHYVSNVRVRPAERDDEYNVRCNLLVYRSRGESPQYDLLSADRQDLLRRTPGGGWTIARRLIALDQSTVNSRNLSIFF